jgi:dTDP-glucose 4,6-dehydratase
MKLVLTQGEIGKIYNICTGAHQTNYGIAIQICNSLATLMGKDPKDLIGNIKYVKDRPGHDRRYAMSSKRISDELGWSPTVPVEEGLQETVRWYFERFANETSTFDNGAGN